MKWYWRRRWMMLAALTAGTTLQLTACREEVALLGLRTAMSTFTLPINNAIWQFFFGLG